MLEIVAKQVDKQPIQDSSDWHRQLLLRMKNDLPGIRAAVLSEETHDLMNGLRSFRHRQRNTYGSDLDPVRVIELAREAVDLPILLKNDPDQLAKTLLK